jgi:hypothetical protein
MLLFLLPTFLTWAKIPKHQQMNKLNSQILVYNQNGQVFVYLCNISYQYTCSL